MPLYVLAFVLLAPVLIPVGLILQCAAVRRMRAVAARFPCTRCGAILGKDSLRRADIVWGEYVQRLQREHPGMRLRLNRTLHAICGACGQGYRFLERENKFTEEPLRDEEK